MTAEQSRTMTRLRVTNDWQHIADEPLSGAVVLTAPVGIRWVDAIIALDGSVTYDRPAGY